MVRRIDELGRIVIPKEIRKNLKIKDGENLEIFIEEEAIIFKKFSKLEDSIKYISELSTLVNKITGFDILISDNWNVIVGQGLFLKYQNQELSSELLSVMEKRENIFSKDQTEINITNKNKEKGCFTIATMIVDSDIIGLLILRDNYYNPSQLIISNIMKELIIGQFKMGN